MQSLAQVGRVLRMTPEAVADCEQRAMGQLRALMEPPHAPAVAPGTAADLPAVPHVLAVEPAEPAAPAQVPGLWLAPATPRLPRAA